MAKLLITSADHPAQEMELKSGVNLFGRNPSNDLHVMDPGVSRTHCEIHVEGDNIFVRDLNSTNGTFIDRQQIIECPMHSGQILQIGAVEMKLDAPIMHLSIPELPIPEVAVVVGESGTLADGYAAC